MKRHRLRRVAALALGTLVLSAPWGAVTHAEPDAATKAEAVPPGVDPRADEWLRKMAGLLTATPRFSVEAEETFDVELAHAYRVQLTNVRRLTVERPSHFAAVAEGDTLHRSSWYDGRTLTVLNRKLNLYATLDMPGTVDVVLDRLAMDYDVVLPLSDLIYSDPYHSLLDGVLYGKYLGVHQAAGVPCHHLSFGQEGLAWQIWIEAGEKPLPRKLAIAYWENASVPQYQAVLRNWNLAPASVPEQFTFTAPATAKRIDLSELQSRE